MPSEASKWPIPPEYPTLFEKPSVGTIFFNFSGRDYMKIVTLTSTSMVWGYLAGGSANARGSAMAVAAVMGATAGYYWAYGSSLGRLKGFYPNDAEVAKFGKRSPWDSSS